jgi:hypothetical protein
MRLAHISLEYLAALKLPFIQGQICLVWEENVECVHQSKWATSSADFSAAFWLFIVVGVGFLI